MQPRSLILLLSLLAAGLYQTATAQHGDDALWREMMEMWADQNVSDAVPDDLMELLLELEDNPININDTSSPTLALLPFITSFHRELINAYIAQNGEMVTLEELWLINGFDSTLIQMLLPFVTVEPVGEKVLPNLRQVIRHGHSNLRIGGKSSRPLSRGYTEEIYDGSPYRLYFRYNFKYGDRVSLLLSGDKDAGEALRFGTLNTSNGTILQKGFDFYGYHLMLSDIGVVRRVIVGKYNLQFGQGATLWSGSAPWMAGNMPLRRFGQGIRPASALCEYGFLRGAAATLSLLPQWLPESLELTLFYSNNDNDATLSTLADTSDDGEQLFQSLYQSGYHRTANELSKKGVLKERFGGVRLELRRRNFQIGATATGTLLGSEIVPADYIYNTFAFSGKRNFNYGIDATLRYRRLLLFGEGSLAINDSVWNYHLNYGWLPAAAVTGMQMHFDANTLLSLAWRYASPTFHNLHANIIGQGSTAQNETGMTLFFQTRLPGYFDLQASADLFRHPWMRYRVYSPSLGSDYRLKVSKELSHGTLLECSYRYKASQRNSDKQLYYVEDIRRQQMQLTIDHKPSERWRFLSRVIYSWFQCDDHEPQDGFMMMQQVDWHTVVGRSPLTVSTRLSIFDVSGYDARIYCYENDLMYEYGVPMLTGRGLRSFLLLRYEPTERLSLGVKYTFSCYPEHENVGSGYDITPGPTRHELKAQMRLKW